MPRKNKNIFVPSQESRQNFNNNTVSNHQYETYKTGNTWRCEKSPSGAHYFYGDNNKITCKYCGVVRIPKDVLEESKNASNKNRKR